MSVLERLAGAGLLTAEMGESGPGEEPWVFVYRIGRQDIWWGGDQPTWINDGEARLQVHLQRECAARGWSWSLFGDPTHRPGYCAHIYQPGAYETVNYLGATAVEALAAALLAALEAPAGAGA